MSDTGQFSLRIEPELIRRIDHEAEKEYKTRTELIKEAMQKLLREKEENESLKRLAAELWIKGEISETKLKKVMNDKEIRDLRFGKQWIEDVFREISR